MSKRDFRYPVACCGELIPNQSYFLCKWPSDIRTEPASSQTQLWKQTVRTPGSLRQISRAALRDDGFPSASGIYARRARISCAVPCHILSPPFGSCARLSQGRYRSVPEAAEVCHCHIRDPPGTWQSWTSSASSGAAFASFRFPRWETRAQDARCPPPW